MNKRAIELSLELFGAVPAGKPTPSKHKDTLEHGVLVDEHAAYANKAMVEADLILNVGSRFDDRIIGQAHRFGANAKIVHVDIDPAEMNKMIVPDIQIVGDAKAVLGQLLAHGAKRLDGGAPPARTPWRRMPVSTMRWTSRGFSR